MWFVPDDCPHPPRRKGKHAASQATPSALWRAENEWAVRDAAARDSWSARNAATKALRLSPGPALAVLTQPARFARGPQQGFRVVGATGIEPVTSAV